jgi:putative sigma-54 modulation protein
MEVPMNIKMHSIRFDADEKLIQFIDTKVKKLPTVYDDIMGAEIFLRLDKDTTERENKLVEIKLDVKGQSVFAKKQCKTFEEATDLSVDALKKQLLKRKEKIRKK